MNSETHDDRLERLISRFLDGEARPEERRALNQTLARDPAARALFDETQALDREATVAMRQALGRSRLLIAPRRVSGWAGGLGLAAAAAIAALFIWQPGGGLSGDARNTSTAGPSWGFAPAPPPGDSVAPAIEGYHRPQVKLRDTQRDWLVVPGERPGEFLIIEVNHVRTQGVRIHQDY